jgi:hypothetical protein
MLQGRSLFRSHQVPAYLFINTGYTIDEAYELECPVQPACSNISPVNIL